MALNHVALTVADRERSAAFYADYFGLTVRVHEDDHLLILGAPGAESSAPGPPGAGSLLALTEGPPAAADLPRTNHFGFQVPDGDEVRAARGRFRAAGVEEAEWQDSHGFVRVQVFDPDGYRVEVFSF